MTKREVVATLVIGSFILVATIALALILVNERLEDQGGPMTEPPVGGAHHADMRSALSLVQMAIMDTRPSVAVNSALAWT
jgi:hypothetical protein